jgi:hypothetical protein
MPRQLVDPLHRVGLLPLHQLGASFAYQAALFVVAAACASMLLVGYRTRLATVASWVLLASLHGRNPYIGDLGDEVLRQVLFWCMFLPLGRCFSLDARRQASTCASGPHLSIATVALLGQLVIVYFVGAVLKSGDDWGRDGTAIYYMLSQDWMVKPFGRSLLAYRGVLESMTRVVLVFEYVGPWFLLWPLTWGRLRTAAVAAFWAFHLTLVLMVSLGIFPWILCAALTAFLPPWFWDRLASLPALAGARFHLHRLLGQPARPGPVRDPAVLAAGAGRPGALRRAAAVAPNAVCGVLFVHVLAANGATVFDLEPPRWQAAAGRALGLNQNWVMYAPKVPRADGWYVLHGALASGSIVDLSDPGAVPTWDRPPQLWATHDSWRWAIYTFRLEDPAWRSHLLRYAAWLCEDWNSRHQNGERLVELQIHFMDETTPPAYVSPIVARRLLLAAACPAAG